MICLSFSKICLSFFSLEFFSKCPKKSLGTNNQVCQLELSTSHGIGSFTITCHHLPPPFVRSRTRLGGRLVPSGRPQRTPRVPLFAWSTWGNSPLEKCCTKPQARNLLNPQKPSQWRTCPSGHKSGTNTGFDVEGLS